MTKRSNPETWHETILEFLHDSESWWCCICNKPVLGKEAWVKTEEYAVCSEECGHNALNEVICNNYKEKKA